MLKKSSPFSTVYTTHQFILAKKVIKVLLNLYPVDILKAGLISHMIIQLITIIPEKSISSWFQFFSTKQEFFWEINSLKAWGLQQNSHYTIQILSSFSFHMFVHSLITFNKYTGFCRSQIYRWSYKFHNGLNFTYIITAKRSSVSPKILYQCAQL